jgi:hypothetical protein
MMQPTRALEMVNPLMEFPEDSLRMFSPLRKRKYRTRIPASQRIMLKRNPLFLPNNLKRKLETMIIMMTRQMVTIPLNCTMVAAANVTSASSGAMKNYLRALVAPLITAVS